MGTTIGVAVRALSSAGDTTMTGRVPRWSWPAVGLGSTSQVSPRWVTALRGRQAVRQSMPGRHRALWGRIGRSARRACRQGAHTSAARGTAAMRSSRR